MLPVKLFSNKHHYSLTVKLLTQALTAVKLFNKYVKAIFEFFLSGAYFKSPEVYTNPPSKYGHSSKSSHSSESATVVCPTYDGQVDTWERNLKKTSSNKLNESQSSLTSRSSSLGNKTQSTSLSNEQNTRGSRKSGERRGRQRQEVSSLDRNPRNIVVSTNGDNFETKLSH